MNQDEAKEKLEAIEKLYQEYLLKIDDLKKEKNKIIDDFVAELEKEKINELRNRLNN